MLTLKSTQTLELVTALAGSIDWQVNWADMNGAALSGTDNADGNINTAGTTVVVTAPTNQRLIKSATFRNAGTASHRITLQKDTSGTNRTIIAVALAAGETLMYGDPFGFVVIDSGGRIKGGSAVAGGSDGRTIEFLKVGTAAEAAGVRYSFGKDSGSPGAWAPGTPGLNGRATDGNSAGDAGCLTFPDPASGSVFLTGFTVQAGVTGLYSLIDILWVNSGLVVTTTTAQAITPVALPARDLNGSTNGAGVMAALLVVAATTNASAITNMTLSYTNQDGTAGRTATMASFPATAVIGTFVPFLLQAGDTGIRSVQSVTLGTSLATGTVSLVLYRTLAQAGCPVINTGFDAKIDPNTGVKLYPDTCGIITSLPSAVTAQTIQGSMTIAYRG